MFKKKMYQKLIFTTISFGRDAYFCLDSKQMFILKMVILVFFLFHWHFSILMQTFFTPLCIASNVYDESVLGEVFL